MRPIRLKLEGFKGIFSGMGKASIELNLKPLGEAQLVAITGPNGAGKTTVRDNLHPYRVMPSRSSAPTPGSFSYYDQIVDGQDGLKELDWEQRQSLPDGHPHESCRQNKKAGSVSV